mmetsp:Transcript_12758/g.37925  ORF Transcript_12758/g.37925 Transcript_12758/m.37925 type:complete len:352 (-) Transcript_12758:6-1061(-)
MTLTVVAELKPSSWLSSSSIVRCTSRTPESSPPPERFWPMASSSSMKMMAGDFSRASVKASRTILAPSPMNICTSWGPASFRKVAFVAAAQALAIMVLPVPGGPCMRTPFGGEIPMVSKRSAWVIGSTMASISSWICLSRPPMSLYWSVGRSSTSMAFTRESYSAGSLSSTRYESLFTPTRSFGLRSSASTRPMTGRKIVCRVVVLTTRLLPLRIMSTSWVAPSSSSSSGSSSRISATLATRCGSWRFSLIFSLLSFDFSSMVFSSWWRRCCSLFITRQSFSSSRMRCWISSAPARFSSSVRMSSSPQMSALSRAPLPSSGLAAAASADMPPEVRSRGGTGATFRIATSLP